MPCGVGDYTLSLARALAGLPDVEVAVLTSLGAGPDDTARVQVFPSMPNWGLAQAPRLLRALCDWRPDVLHVQYPTQGYRLGLLPAFIPLLASAAGVRVVRTWHENPGPLGAPHFILEAVGSGPYVVVRPEFTRKLQWWLRPLVARREGGYIAGASAIPRSSLSEGERRCLRERLLKGRRRLIAFFGFLYRWKHAELLFDIADSTTDAIVIAGEAGVDATYLAQLQRLADSPPWRGAATMTGYLSEVEAANLLAVADAVILPFAAGGGVWNSSISAAVLQGAPVITTSDEAGRFDEQRLIYFAAPGDVADMRAALGRLAGKRRRFDPEIDRDEWVDIAAQHLALYRSRAETGP
jgi:hypothetical protein